LAGKEIAYIDALLFAAGATSQAGMNPINMNLLNTWQQVPQPLPKTDSPTLLLVCDILAIYDD
jgi:hypothetical protein